MLSSYNAAGAAASYRGTTHIAIKCLKLFRKLNSTSPYKLWLYYQGALPNYFLTTYLSLFALSIQYPTTRSQHFAERIPTPKCKHNLWKLRCPKTTSSNVPELHEYCIIVSSNMCSYSKNQLCIWALSNEQTRPACQCN